MPTKPTQLRIPPDLLTSIDEAAEAEGVTRTAWLLKAAQAQLGTTPEPLRPATPAEPRYRCPIKGCGHAPKSPFARCPDHARLPVPA